ncbi:MAG: hypothetical protein WBO22_12235 [Shewanella indica]|uniref:hypothetical protein n=1 Tax=Shewanella indica TaxID=768528 RepID=UPI003C788928
MQNSIVKVLSNVWCERLNSYYQDNELEVWQLTYQLLSYPVLVPKLLMQYINPNGQVVDVTLLETQHQITIQSVAIGLCG